MAAVKPQPPDASRFSRLGVTVVFLTATGAALWSLLTSRWIWRTRPYPTIDGLIPPAADVTANVARLFQLEGGYAQFLWAWMVFLGLSAWFVVAGRAILSLILKDQTQILSLGERWTIRWLVGSWALGLLWMALGSAGLWPPILAKAACVAGLVWGGVQTGRILRRVHWGELSAGFFGDPWLWPAAVLALWALSWSLLCAMPQYYWDSLMINLALPGQYAAEGRFAPNPFHIYSYFPQNTEILATWALTAGSGEAVFLLQWGFMAALLALIFFYLRRTASTFTALWAVMFLMGSFLCDWLVYHVKNDLQTGVFLVAQWWAMLHALDQPPRENGAQKRWALLAGLCAGIAMGHKHTALPSIAGTTALLAAYSWTSLPHGRKMTLLPSYLLGAVAAVSPWLLRTTLLTGHPLYPFLGAKLLFPWHAHPATEYALSKMGWAGIAEYLRNFSQYRPIGTIGNNTLLWWGFSAWMVLLGLVCFMPPAASKTRWTSAMGLSAWVLSLWFALKPPYHVGPIIFMMCLCLGQALELTSNALRRAAWVTGLAALVAVLSFFKTWDWQLTKSEVYMAAAITLSGHTHTQYIPSIGTDTNAYASVDEIQWANHLINKYTDPGDVVLCMGHVRPYGLKRKHVAAFSLNLQPILYFAAQSRDANDLRDRLMAAGVRHILLDQQSWLDWLRNQTPDGPHGIAFSLNDLRDINAMMTDHAELRFTVPSGRILWFSLVPPGKTSPFPPIPFDESDLYSFPFQYAALSGQMRRMGHPKAADALTAGLRSLQLPRAAKKFVEMNASVISN